MRKSGYFCVVCGKTVECSLTIERSRVRISAGLLAGNSLGQAAHTHAPLSPSSIIWYQPMSDNFFGWDGWLKVTCGLTVCTQGPATGQTLGITSTGEL